MLLPYHFAFFSPHKCAGFYSFRPVAEDVRDPVHKPPILEHGVQHRSLLPNLPAGRHQRLLHHAILPHQLHRIVQIHRAADVVGDYLHRVAHLEVTILVHREHPMLFREPL